MSISRGKSICVAPPGLDSIFADYPGLTPWARRAHRRCVTKGRGGINLQEFNLA